MSEGSERGRELLGQFVLARRKELGLSVREAARRAGVMRPTWTGLEQGNRRTADYNFAAMERTLDWRPGSFESVLRGGEPTPNETAPTAPTSPTASTDRAVAPTTPTPPPIQDTTAVTVGEHGAGVDEARTRSAVLWSDIVDVLDARLGSIGQAASVGGTQRLWGAEQITLLARRLRPHQVDRDGRVVVGWPDVVASLEATIAAIRQDSSMSSEARLWGIEMVVDVAAGLRAAQLDVQQGD